MDLLDDLQRKASVQVVRLEDHEGKRRARWNVQKAHLNHRPQINIHVRLTLVDLWTPGLLGLVDCLRIESKR